MGPLEERRARLFGAMWPFREESEEEKLQRLLDESRATGKELAKKLERSKALSTAIVKAIQDNDRDTALQLAYILQEVAD